MGRKVVERFDHGEYVFEEVVEMLPLGEDRETVFVPKIDDSLIDQLFIKHHSYSHNTFLV